MTRMWLPSAWRRALTAPGTSPWIRCEFCQASGASSVVETTCFGIAFSVGASGSSAGWFGQWAAKISYVRRPSSRPPADEMPPMTNWLNTSSK